MDVNRVDLLQNGGGAAALAQAAGIAHGQGGAGAGRWLGRSGLAWTVLMLSLWAALALWQYTAADQERRVRDRFGYLAEKQRSTLVQRMEDYEQMLLGVAGLFEASGEVTRQEFHDYIQSHDMDRRLPGVQGTGYVVMLTAGERAAHEAQVRAQGFVDYAIRPLGEREQLSSILYLEPFSGRNLRAFGYDMYSEPVRREAMERARDTGMPALSGKVVLVQEESGAQLPGFLLYLPLYRKGQPLDTVAARRAALLGFVYSPFRVGDLMLAIFRHASDDGEVEVYDGEVALPGLLYASEQGVRQARYAIDYPIEIAGRHWVLRVRSGRGFEQHYDTALPQLVLVSGLAVDLLLFALLYLHARHIQAMTAAAAELQRSRDRFQTLLENVPATVFRCEPQAPWRVSYISAGIESFSGRAQQCYLTGECNLEQLVHPDDQSWVKGLIDRAVERREVYAFDYLVDPVQELWISVRGRASYGVAGQALWIDGATFDISAQKRAERQLAEYRDLLERRVAERTTELAATAASLRRANEQMQAIFDTAPVGIATLREGVFESCNRKLEEILGCGPDELLGRERASLFEHGEEARTALRQAREQTARGETVKYEVPLRRRDGSMGWVRVVERTLDPKEPVQRLISITKDITDEHAAHVAMAEARRAAEAANAAKSAFLSNMSHELRTPLNAIMGMGHLLRSTALDARQQGYLGKMLVSGQDLLALIDDILNYVRIETGTLELERSEFALADLLVSVLDRIRDKAAAKGLSLRAESAPELPSRLKGDAGRIGQVLHKLAENAVKFTRAGEMSLAARLLAREGDELLLRFEVRDTGIGLSAADQSRLFRAFEQGDNSSTRQHGGTGLGLAIAQRLVDLLGGEIGVESEPGRGSLFWFTVRLGVAQGVAGTLALPPPAMPVDPPRAAVPQAVHDEGQWLRVCAELIGLLEQDDTESLQVLEGNGALLRAALGPDFERLADALHRFDFALALALLQERH